MELIRNWFIGMSCAAMVVAVAGSITPEGSLRRISRLAGGLLMMLAAISPVSRMEDRLLDRVLTEYQLTTEQYHDALAEKNDQLYKTIIEENTAAYILDKARALGILCRAEVTFAYDEKGNPYPDVVSLFGDWTEDQRGRLSTILESELGIPPQKQYFERAEI